MFDSQIGKSFGSEWVDKEKVHLAQRFRLTSNKRNLFQSFCDAEQAITLNINVQATHKHLDNIGVKYRDIVSSIK